MISPALYLCAFLTLVIILLRVPILFSRWLCRKGGHSWVNMGALGEYRCKRCGRRFDMT